MGKINKSFLIGFIAHRSLGILSRYLSVSMPVDVDGWRCHHSRALELPGMGAILQHLIIVTGRKRRTESRAPLAVSLTDTICNTTTP